MSRKIKMLLSVVSMILCITILSSIPTQAIAETINQNNDDPKFSSLFDVKGDTQKEGNIVTEIKSARTETSKEFMLDDGTTMLVDYGEPVHYKNDKGNWVEYNNTLVSNNTATADEAVETSYTNKKSNINVDIASNTKDNKLIDLDTSSGKVSWKYLNSQNSKARVVKNNQKLKGNEKFTTIANLTSEVNYNDIYDNVDLECFVLPTGVKENIILEKADAQNEFQIEYDIQGLKAKQVDNKTIQLFKGKKAVYTIAAPYMTDADGNISTDLTIDIVSSKGNKLIVKLTADKKFLNSWGRAYPVTIDPEVAYVGSSNIETAQISSLNKDTVQHQSTHFYLGKNTSTNETYYALIKNKNIENFPANKHIVSAKVSIYPFSTTTSMSIKAYPVTSEWTNSTATYNNVTYDSSKVIEYATSESGSSDAVTFDITKLYKEWCNGTLANNGIYLKSDNDLTDFGGYCCYLSNKLPKTQVIYKDYTGTESNLTYNTVSVGQNAESNISYYTGSLSLTQNIYEGSGSRMPAHITATYNSVLHDKLFANGSPAGYGWQFSFNQYIKETDSTLQSTGYDYIYTDEDGTEHYFKEDESSDDKQWKDEDGLDLILTKDENYLYITDSDEVVQKYNLPSNNGNILSETDKYGNVITYTYNTLGNLTKITDGSGREIKINYAYYSGNSEPRVYSMELPDGNLVKFAYYSNQLLACVVFPDEKSSWFYYTQYTSDGLLNKIEQRDCSGSTDVIGMKYSYSYNSNNQVEKISEYGSNGASGNFLNFTYNDDNTTKVTDRNGLSETYTFDNYGNTVAILNANGYIENTRDSEDNTLSISGGSESYTRNYIEESREPSSSYYSKVNGSTSTDGQLTYDSSTEEVNGEKVQYLGSKSIKIKNTGNSQFYTMAKHQYDDSDLFGKTLTFSSYVKTDDIEVDEDADGVLGAFIRIECFDSSGKIIEEQTSPGISGSSKWQRISTTADIPENTDHFNIYCGIKDAQGTAWFDCLQLEEGNVMNDYNALQNSDFSTTNAWSNASANNIKQIDGNGTSDRFVYQYVNINKANVSFNISGEAKADSVPLSEEKRTFGIALKIYYEGDTANSNIETHYIPFNDATSAYHSIGATITPGQSNKVIETVAFSFVYQYNENTMYLKNAMLNISNTAYDSSAAEDDNNTSSSNEETDTEITYPYHGSVSTYDSYGNTITTKKGSVIKDSNDEEVIDTSKPFISTSSTYDSTGNYVTSEVDASGNTVSYTVDTSTGNTTKVTDAMGNETDYSYDVVGNLTSISSSSTSNTYTYNSVNQLSAISHNEFSYNFNYDVYNHLLSTVIGDTALVTNTYDSNNGNLKKTTYGNSQGLTYSYDDYDRVTSISSIVDGPLVSYTYNKKGLVTKAVERKSGQITEFQYDCNGNLLRKNTTSNDGNTIAYSSGYDSSGNPTETLNINGETRTVTSGTDDSDNSYIDNGDSKVITFTDSLGRTESVNQVDKSTNKSLETSYQYLTGAESSSTTELVSEYIQSYDGTDLVDYQYTYDANGNITEIKDNNTVIFKYKYDSLNQLKEEYNYIQNYYINYSYDGNGNILAQHTQRLDPTYGYPTGKDFGNAFYYNDSEWKDKLTKINNSEITYDAIGNPLNYRDGMTMKWQVGRELAGITLDDNTSISYTYNTDGMRTCKNVGGTKTYYYYDDSNNLVGLTQGSTTMFFYYDSDNSPVSMSYNGTMYYYVKDLQGDIVKIINKNGTVYGTYTYDSWGNIVSSTGDSSVSRLNPLRYRGYVYDNDTKLYYLQSRYYDPAIGRFVNPDVYFDTDTGTLLSTNMYSYCENNPIISRDLDGRCTAVLASVAVAGASNSWNPVGWVLIGVAIGVTIVYAVDKYQSYNPDPYARPNQKKQGRELKNKARKKSTWKPKKTPKKPKKHTPGKDHRKYK